MSKNMTRKGLAFGAGAALIATGFAGAPATAAVDDNAVSLIPRTGTEYGGFIDNVFDLKTTTSLAAAGGSGNLKYKVVDDDLELRWDYDNQTPDAGTTNYSVSQTALEADDLTITGAGTATATLTFRTALVQFQEGEEITISSSDVDTPSISLTNADSGGQISISAADAVDTDKEIVTITVTDGIVPTQVASVSLSDLASTGVPDDEIADGVKTITGTTDSDTDGFLESFTFTIDDETSAGQAAENLSAGSGVFTLHSNFNGLVDGNHTVSADVKTAGSESFSFVVDDSANNYLASRVFDVAGISIASKDTGPHSNALDSYDVITADTAPFAAPSVTGLAYTPVDSDDTFVIDTGRNVDGTNTQYLRLASTSTNTHSVEVTAWIDENGDDLIDPTENSSSTRTITFYKWADSGYALNIETPVAGEQWEVYASFNDNINASMITDQRLEVALGVLDSGALEAAEANSNVNGSNTAFTAPTNTFLVWDDAASHVEDFWGLKAVLNQDVSGSGFGTANTFYAGLTYAGQLWLDNSALGNVVYTGIGGAVAEAFSGVIATTNENVLQESATVVKVREEYTGNVEFSLYLAENDETVAATNPITGSAGDVPVAEGTEVTVEIAEGSADLDADSTVTAGGLTLANGDDAIEFTITTDANGFATFTLSNDEGVAGDDIDITMTHAGTSKSAAVEWIAPREANAFLTGATNVSILAEDEWSITYTAMDEFGAPLTGGDYRVEVQYYEAVGGTQKTTGVSLDAAGQGTLTVTDESEANGSFAVNADLQELNTSAVFADYTHEVDSTVYVVADTTPADITLVDTEDTSGNHAAIELVAGVNKETITPNTGDAPLYDTDEHFTITGVVTNASGNAVRGAEVTLSGEGLIFNTGTHANAASTGIYAVDSLTVTTSATGAYSAEVRSNTAGDHLLTVTSGSATETETLEFEQAVSTTGANVSLTAPANAVPGSTFSVTATITDRFGNPVETGGADDFSLTYTGPGVALSIPTETNALGQATFAVLLGSNDTGSGSVEVEYDADGSTTTTSDAYTVSRTVVVGSSATQKVNAGSFKGYVAVYALGYEGSRLSAKIGNDWVIVDPIVNNESDNLFRVTDFTGAGVDIAVRIYIDRVLIDTINLTTK